jgi:two-component system, OmpR family, response regulator
MVRMTPGHDAPPTPDVAVPSPPPSSLPPSPPAPAPSGEGWRILVVDDEPDLVEVLCGAMRYEEWEVLGASTGEEAVRLAAEWRPDAVVLDMMLPDFDGLEVLSRIHADRPEVRVLFLTARDAVEDRIAGITAGGDDYVTKPFSLTEVIARLRGMLRRAEKPGAAESTAPDGDSLVVGDLVMDEKAREVTRSGETVELSPTEFSLLRFLMRHPRQVLSKAQILEEVWSYDFGGQAHVVELYISYLRKKVDAGRTPMIHTVRGSGYVLKAPAP